MDCPSMTEIVIVWNNNQKPEQVGFINKEEWKRPVYFVQTPYNSMDFRYMIPKESKAKVFFSMDDDMTITCKGLLQGFQFWRKQAVGDIGPLVSYGARAFNHDSKKNSFAYSTTNPESEYYSLTLTGYAWISRFYMDLYYIKGNKMIQNLRKIVQQKNNCDDILMNYIVSYFFPETIPRKLDASPLNGQALPDSQSQKGIHYTNRTKCIKEFTDTIGYNPLKIVNHKRFTQILQQFPTMYKYLVYLRKKQIQSTFMLNEGSFVEKQIQFESQMKQKCYQYVDQIYQKQKGNPSQIDQVMKKLTQWFPQRKPCDEGVPEFQLHLKHIKLNEQLEHQKDMFKILYRVAFCLFFGMVILAILLFYNVYMSRKYKQFYRLKNNDIGDDRTFQSGPLTPTH